MSERGLGGADWVGGLWAARTGPRGLGSAEWVSADWVSADWASASASMPRAPPVPAGFGARRSGVPGDAGARDRRGEVTLVHDRVVALAEQSPVVEARQTAAVPGHDVVGVAPGGWHRAARVGAPPVTGDEGKALAAGEEATASADVEPT